MKFDIFLFSFAWWFCNRYLKFVLLHAWVLTSMPKLYVEIIDPKSSLIMYSNLMLINWISKHLDNYGWYIDYSTKLCELSMGFMNKLN
jgi:hypothetical protein